MSSYQSLAAGALVNLLVVLGLAFCLSRGLALLAGRSPAIRAIAFGGGFGALAVVSMLTSFPIGEELAGDIRNAVIAVAALIGGPIAAVVSTAIAAAARIAMGGHPEAGLAGLVLSCALGIGFARLRLPRSAGLLAAFGITLAASNMALPPVAWLFGHLPPKQALQVSALIMAMGAALYPAAILLLGGLLETELKRLQTEGDLRAANRRLYENEGRFHEVFDRSCIAMAWGDVRARRLTRVNAQYCAFTGYSEAELLEMRDEATLFSAADNNQTILFTPPVQRGEQSFSDEKRYVRKDGAEVWGRRTITVVRENGEPRYVLAIIEDITERKRAREQIAYMARHDALTGLHNRTVLQSRLAELLAERAPVAVLYLDLDHFKEINDTLGHQAGDALLTQIAQRLRSAIGADDTVARLGGDEFAILHVAPANRDETDELAERIIRRIAKPFMLEGEQVSVGVSIGVAMAFDGSLRSDELFRKADIALYAAKADGRGAYRYFEPAMEERLLARQALKADLAQALANGELEIELQPIVHLRLGRVSCFEALLRWNHPERGRVPPSEFIPMAEESREIIAIGQWVVEQACAAAAAWPERVMVSVNVSPTQFLDRTLPLRIAAALGKSGLDPALLVLEITESVLLHDTDANLALLRDLRGLGVKIALDDFGSGYSSLAYLRQFAFDKIKIDRAFISDLARSGQSQAIVRAVVGIGRSLELSVTAEGVETEEQLAAIRQQHCDEAQGFLISPPLPAAQASEFLAQHHARQRVSAAAAG